MQKLLIALGVVFLALGLLWPWLSRLGLGRLPGDIALQREGFSFFFHDHHDDPRQRGADFVVPISREVTLS